MLKQDVELPAIKKPSLDFDAVRESPGVAVSIFLLYVIQQVDIDMFVIRTGSC